jgi:hypothetical protein
MTLVLLIHLLTLFAMTVVLWAVQRIWYPKFLRITRDSFLAYHSRYTRQITLIAAPLMSVELITALWLFVEWYSSLLAQGIALWMLGINMGGIVVIWGMTMLVHVPQHDYLSNGWHEETIQALIRTNWVRTALYSLRCVLWEVQLYTMYCS